MHRLAVASPASLSCGLLVFSDEGSLPHGWSDALIQGQSVAGGGREPIAVGGSGLVRFITPKSQLLIECADDVTAGVMVGTVCATYKDAVTCFMGERLLQVFSSS
jgi:hypothetical protein